MPKYWGKNYFAHGSFPEVGQKQKTEKKKKERKSDRKLVITIASYALQRHLGWRTQIRLGQQWPASLRPPPWVAHASTPGPKNDFQAFILLFTAIIMDLVI